MDKLTKQSHLLHSLLAQFRKDTIEEIAKSISKNFDVPIDEAMDKCSVFITGLLVHTFDLLIIEKMENGKQLAERFLENIGKSESDIKKIHETYGDLKTNTKNKFKEILEDYLGVPTDHALSDFYYLRVNSACKSIIQMVSKQTDKIGLKDGAFNYSESAKDEESLDEIKAITENLNNTERVYRENLMDSDKCKATNRKGEPCKNKAMKDSLYWWSHSFGRFKGIPFHKNAGFPTLLGVIAIVLTLFFGIRSCTMDKKIDQILKAMIQDYDSENHSELIQDYPLGYVYFVINLKEKRITMKDSTRLSTDYVMNWNNAGVTALYSHSIEVRLPDVFVNRTSTFYSNNFVLYDREINKPQRVPLINIPGVEMWFELLVDDPENLICLIGFREEKPTDE